MLCEFFFNFYFILFSLLECNCFTMLCQFLLYNKVNQLYVNIYPIPLEPPYDPHIPPLWASQSTELSSLCCTAASHQLAILHTVVYISQCFSPSSFLILYLQFTLASLGPLPFHRVYDQLIKSPPKEKQRKCINVKLI